MRRRDFLAAGAALAGPWRGVLGEGSQGPAGRASAERLDRSLDERFDEVVALAAGLMLRHRIPGAALGVLHAGELQMRGLGVTSVEDPRPVTADTIFELASLSKTVTATAVMALVEQGRLELDAPLRRWLPGFRVQDEAASASVTLRNLLTHAAGWEPRYRVEEGDGALARWVETTGDLDQVAPPGRLWSYDNPSFGLLGRVVEVVTDQDFRDALETLVFAPLELERASARLTEVVTWPVALGHRPGPDGGPVVVRPYSMGSSIPAGGVNMSLAALMRYLAFHLGELDPQGARTLTPASREAMRTAWLAKEPTTEHMGLGFHLRTLGDVLTAAHGGTAGAGHRCHLQLVPGRRLAFAILTNHTEGWRLLQEVERATLSGFADLALEPNQPICGYRGHTETLDHVTPLPTQPPAAPYLGSYRRGRGEPTEVRPAPGGGLLVGDEAAPVLFYGRDVAFASGEDRINHDFIREGDEVRWMRVAGQVLRKEG